jgi:hypothetical protein
MKRLVIAVLLLTSCGSALAQSSISDTVLPVINVPSVFDIGGSGARARGMGNAYIGAGDDAAALTWNPAGIYQLDHIYMTFGVNSYSPRGKALDYGFYTTSVGQLSVKQTGSFSSPGLFSLVSPFRIKGHGFVGGISYGHSYDEASNGASEASAMVDPDGPAALYDSTEYSVGLRSAYHARMTPVVVGFATRLGERMAAGLSLSVMNGKSVDKLSRHDVADNYFVAEYYPQAANLDVQSMVIDSSKFSGMSIALGFKYDLPKLALGAVIKLPYRLRQTTDRSIIVVTRVNGLVRDNGTVTQFRDDRVVDIHMPFAIAVGGAYKLNDKTTLAIDLDYRRFSGRKVDYRDSLRLVPGAKDEEFFTIVDKHWRNVISFRGGGEYLWSTGVSVLPVVPLRAGFAIVPIPRPNESYSQVSGTATANSFSLGTGVRWTQISIDLAYSYTKLDQTLDDFFGIPYRVEGRSHQMVMTLTGYF